MLQSRKVLDSAMDTSSSSASSDDIELRKTTPPGGFLPGQMSAEMVAAAKKKDKAYGASWPMQYVTLFRRAIKVRRFEALSVQDLAQTLCVSVLGGMLP